MSPLTFPQFCAAMDAAGVEVHVALHGDQHTIRLLDFHRCRSLDLPVSRSFDAATVLACCSLALTEQTPLARAWPELVGLARASVGVSGNVGSGRLS